MHYDFQRTCCSGNEFSETAVAWGNGELVGQEHGQDAAWFEALDGFFDKQSTDVSGLRLEVAGFGCRGGFIERFEDILLLG